MVLKLLVSNDCGNSEMKRHQNHIRQVLQSKGIDFVEIDIGSPTREKEKEELVKVLKKKPPHLFNNDNIRGGYEEFATAIERQQLFMYLDLECPKEEVEYLYRFANEK